MPRRGSAKPTVGHKAVVSPRTAKIAGYGIAVGCCCVALILGLAVIPADTWSERWLHVLITAFVLMGLGGVIGLALMVFGGIRGADQQHLS